MGRPRPSKMICRMISAVQIIENCPMAIAVEWPEKANGTAAPSHAAARPAKRNCEIPYQISTASPAKLRTWKVTRPIMKLGAQNTAANIGKL